MGRGCDNILETLGNPPVVGIGKLAPSHVTRDAETEAFNPWAR